MTVNEQKYGKIQTSHYNKKGFFTRERLNERGILPDYYMQFVPRVCICGSEVIANETLTQIMCSNSRCICVIASSIEKFCKQFHIKGIGPKKAYAIAESHGCKSILDFFGSSLPEIGMEVQEALRLPVSYARAVQLLYIPEVSSRALAVFQDINSYEQYHKVRNESFSDLSFFMSRVGGDGLLAEQMLHILDTFDWELRNLHHFFNIQVSAKKIVYLAITGDLNVQMQEAGLGRMPKDSFVQILNLLYPEYLIFTRTESVSKAAFVVADHPSSSRKYATAKDLYPNKLVSSRNLLLAATNIDAFFRAVFGEQEGKIYSEEVKNSSSFFKKLCSSLPEHNIGLK